MTITTPRPNYRLRDTDIILDHGQLHGLSSGESDAQSHSQLSHNYVLRFRDGDISSEPESVLKRLQADDVGNLSMTDLVTIILGDDTQSTRALRDYGEKALASETDPQRIAEVLDIDYPRAARLVASFELGRRYYSRRAGQPVYVRHSKQAFEYLKNIGDLRKEQLRGLYLNSRYQVIRDEIISVGSLTANIVHPREVFQPAIEHGAVAVIIAHNHPSGQLSPTPADIKLTEELRAAGILLRIELLDHLIIVPGRYVSLLHAE